MIAFGQNIPSHPSIPKDSRWRNRRSKREYVVIASSKTHVAYLDAGSKRSRTLTAVQWMAGFERMEPKP